MANGQQNHILSHLNDADFRLLEPHLKPVGLPLHKYLERHNKVIDRVYFPRSGFASVVANGGMLPIEIGIIGREGMTGLAVVFGSDRAELDTFIQAAGQGQSIKAKVLRGALDQSSTLRNVLLRFAHSFLNQTARTAVANGRNKIEERLARWLLMADDRIDDDELALTQEFLAMMLAVRRPGVTVAMQALERRGAIARRRGHIVISDRKALEKLSNGTYVPADYE